MESGKWLIDFGLDRVLDPLSSYFKLLGPPRKVDINLKVYDLLDHLSGVWRTNKMESRILEANAKLILEIIPTRVGSCDQQLPLSSKDSKRKHAKIR